jgi:hypothetical protein
MAQYAEGDRLQGTSEAIDMKPFAGRMVCSEPV